MNRKRIVRFSVAAALMAAVSGVTAAQIEKQRWIDAAPDSAHMAQIRAESPGGFLDLNELIGSPLTMDGGVLYSAVWYPDAQTVTVGVCNPDGFAAPEARLIGESGEVLYGSSFGPPQHGVRKFYFEGACGPAVRFIDLVDADQPEADGCGPLAPAGKYRIRFDLQYA